MRCLPSGLFISQETWVQIPRKNTRCRAVEDKLETLSCEPCDLTTNPCLLLASKGTLWVLGTSFIFRLIHRRGLVFLSLLVSFTTQKISRYSYKTGNTGALKYPRMEGDSNRCLSLSKNIPLKC